MAIIKKNELKNMNVVQLKEKETALKTELMKLRSQVATRTRPENPGKVKLIRRTIARIYTYMNMKRRDIEILKEKKEVKNKKQ